MRLDGKVGIVYGAASSMGGAVARAFTGAGAGLYLVGRTRSRLEALAGELPAARVLDVAEVDVDDHEAVHRHADRVLERSGRLDISFNAAGMGDVQGTPLHEMRLDDFMFPIEQAARRHFNTAGAAAKRMTPQRSGAIVMLTSSAAREWRHLMGGFSVACAVVETLNRTLAGELRGTGVRTVCIRANFTPETMEGELPPDASDPLLADTLVPRLPRLSEVAAAAVFAASDGAGAMTGAVLDLSCGAIVA